MNVTVEEMKLWARDNRELAMAVCTARAFAEVEKERVDAYILPLFNTFSFAEDVEGCSGETITNPEHLYLSRDDDRVAAYYAACDKAHQEHGFDGPEGFCPALVAEELQRKAENAMLVSLGEFCGVDGGDFSRSLKMRDKALHLALSACL